MGRKPKARGTTHGQPLPHNPWAGVVLRAPTVPFRPALHWHSSRIFTTPTVSYPCNTIFFPPSSLLIIFFNSHSLASFSLLLPFYISDSFFPLHLYRLRHSHSIHLTVSTSRHHHLTSPFYFLVIAHRRFLYHAYNSLLDYYLASLSPSLTRLHPSQYLLSSIIFPPRFILIILFSCRF